MKKYLFLLLTGFTFNAAQSQESTDALRYAQNNLNGTARFQAMSGAFGALGGDLSSLNINPAGSAVFSNNQAAFTVSSLNTKNNSNYFGTTTSEKDNSFDLNQAGGVFVFKNHNQNSNWKKFSIAINYENTNNFNNTIFSAGTNPNNSVDRYFLSYANGIPFGDFENTNYNRLDFAAQQAYLGYNAFIIDPVSETSGNTQYTSNVPAGGNYYQENTITSQGYNGKLSFNAATSYNDRLYIGLNLNSHFTDFRQATSFYEDNNAPLTNEYTVSKLRFDNELYTYGTGFSFQLGAIAKVTNELRLGLAYESSTWYHLNDEFTQSLVAVSSKNGDADTNDVADPRITNVYAPYKLQTPSKITGSLAYIFGRTGLISIDYAIKDYSKTQFKPENEFTGVNTFMTNTFDNAAELRIGTEYKIEKLSLRAGYRFEQSPYKNKNTVGDLTGYSAGLGYSFGSTKVDLAYAYAERDSQNSFFSQGLTDGAKINSINNHVSLTLLFEL